MSDLVELPREKYDASAFNAFSAGSEYSLGSARAMGWLAQLAYEHDESKISSILSDWGLTLEARFDRLIVSLPSLADRDVVGVAQPQGLVAIGRGAAFVVFSGTDPVSLAHWITNFALDMTNDVHAGFAHAANAAWPDVSQALAAHESTPVFVSGHSLGAALAVLIADRLRGDLGRIANGVYTFGMPRTGGASFAGHYNETLGNRTFRFVHGDDIVPTIPLTIPPLALKLLPVFGYTHVGRPLICGRYQKFDGQVPSPASNAPEGPEISPARLSEVLKELASRRGFVDAQARAHDLTYQWLPSIIGDHVPDRYLLALSK